MKHGFTLDLLAGGKGFGDGTHPTTAMTLDILRQLAEDAAFDTALDMGCGSGLLSMAACHLWPDILVTAADRQPEAVETAQLNVEANGLDDRIHLLEADSYRHRQVVLRAPFDLVIANIAADVHITLAAGLPSILAGDGLAVLSGILRWREEEVTAIYREHGLIPAAEPVYLDDWATLLLARKLPKTRHD